MFPPPWTARCEEERGSNLLAFAREIQDLEKKFHQRGPRVLSHRSHVAGRSMLIRPHSHQGCRRYEARSAGEDDQHTRHAHEQQEVYSYFSKAGGCSTEGMTRVTSHRDQLARDSCLAIPKHAPKPSVAINRGCRLFGPAALLPLQSQVRARARSEATSLARSGNRRTNNSFGQRARRLQSKRYNRNHPLGWKRTASSGVDGVRRTAWGDDEGGASVVDYIRHTIGARRPTENPERCPTPEQEPGDDLSERTVSEDSIGTEALVYDVECRTQPSQGGDCPHPAPRGPSEGPEGRSSGGEDRRREFFHKFHVVEDKKQSHPRPSITPVEEGKVRGTTWRSSSDESATTRLEKATDVFLRQLSDQGRAPWPAILKMSEQTRAIEVGGMGLGDEIMTSLATVLPILGNVERLVAFDNRMTDRGTHAVVKAVQSLPLCSHLDLSQNEVGVEAAHELREYMRNRRCKLRSLAIRKADIDDDECREFMAALGSNISLLEIDLEGNLIGKSETMKVVTSAGAIADMLSMNCTLTSLNLGWNFLRGDSAVTVAQSLQYNRSLQSLSLRHNSFSDYASQILAVSLFENDTLSSVDLSYNSVTPSAAMVLAFALKTNATMKYLDLSGNRIGQNGGEALCVAMRMSTRDEGNLIVNMKNCDTSHKDETLFNDASATGEYELNLQIPYHRVVASELLRIANRKPTAHFRSLKHIVGNKVTNLKLHRESNAAVAPIDPRVDVTRRIKTCIAKGGMLGLGLFAEYADVLGINPEADVASKLMQIWNKLLAKDPKRENRDNGDSGDGDFVVSSFFEALFIFADKDAKGELIVEDLEILFQALQLPHSEARLRHVMSKYDADRSGSVDVEEFRHYMAAAHLKQGLVQHAVLCAQDGKEWKVPHNGTLRLSFVQEPSSYRTLGEVSTDDGVAGLIVNMRQSPTDDARKRLFELATCNSGTYFTSHQAQGVLEVVSSSYNIIDAVAILMPQLASSQECSVFVDSNLDHRAKFKLRFMIGAAWGAILGMPSGHFSLDMQNPRDRLAASKMAAVGNQERQCSKSTGQADTSQHGNWQNFRNAEYNREPVVLTSAWFIKPPSSGMLRFDYVSTSRPDYHQVPLTERRFQRMLGRLGISAPITSSTPIDEEVISAEALLALCTSHFRKMASSSPLYKIDVRDYYRSGSSPDDVSLASWWSAVEVTSVDIDRRDSFAHLVPSGTYVKAWYKLKELEVALCSSCLTSDQLVRILENFPREGQIRAEVVTTFYHKVLDTGNMCLLVDALRPDEEREVLARRGYLNVVNPVFADRYYHLNLAVWDEREMAKILVRLAITEPGENWLDETYTRSPEIGALYGWELPLDWTQDAGPRNVGILTLWYSSSPRRGCAPNLLDLEMRTLCGRVGTAFSSRVEAAGGILAYTFERQQRFSILDKARQRKELLCDEVAHLLESEEILNNDDASTCQEDSTRIQGTTAPSSITALSEEGEPSAGFEVMYGG
ncbi:unnamed protein product [Ectocarpus fasciculatus]